MTGIETLLNELQGLSLGEIDPTTTTTYHTPCVTTADSNHALKQQYLTPSAQLPWDLLDVLQELPSADKTPFYDMLVKAPAPLARTAMRFKRAGLRGQIAHYEETLTVGATGTAQDSMSFGRQTASKSDALRGKSSFLPFAPGGFSLSTRDDAALLHKDHDGLFNMPQGLSRGLDIQSLEATAEIVDIVEENEETDATPVAKMEVIPELEVTGISEIDEILPISINVAASQLTASVNAQKSWAHVVDLDHKLENFRDLVPRMAREWPFELDTFQQEAVYHLEQGDSVFVAAHTSAGKTVVAEYAIAMANRNMTKAIYTSPIKALSNQKFRDFKHDFKEVDVGLITGDVQINAEANCLIMTTEILRSMLYRGADLIRDVEFVIFDEVHYVNDIDRGVVWEEVIIMLPDHVKFILLSATVPNTYEFANWVGRTKQKDIYVISTPKRPVPLEIFVWAKGTLIKVVDAQRRFLDMDFKKHKELLKPPKEVGGGSGTRGGVARGGARGGSRGGPAARGGRGGAGARGGRGGSSASSAPRPGQRDGPNKGTWLNLVQYLRGNNLLPAVIFVFSKKRCEDYVDTLSSVDFLNAREKSEIHMFIDKAASRLKKEDRELPQILKVREFLGRGIAVHHGGLLPIVKECIEILFARGLVKILFATETFAMGLNLPTRTVVFCELRKHDGRGFRNLLPGEFTQMSGRAGRRGLDATGTVIVMSYNEPLEEPAFKEVTLGVPTKLSSQFRLTYNMILNLLRIEALRVEEMIKRSFSENSAQVLLPEHQKNIELCEADLALLQVTPCEECHLDGLETVHGLFVEYKEIMGKMVGESLRLPMLRAQFKVGRLLVYKDDNGVSRPGFIARIDNHKGIFVLLTFHLGEKAENEQTSLPYLPVLPDYIRNFFKKIEFNGNLHFVEARADQIEFVCNVFLKVTMNALIQNQAAALSEAQQQIQVILRFQRKWPEYDWHKIANVALHDLVARKEAVLQQIVDSDAIYCARFKQHYNQLHQQHLLRTKIASLQTLISDENLDLLPDYEQRLSVLKELAFVDQSLNVVLKGRVACEINSGWELIVTELVLDNFLGDFEPEEIVALLSAFVYEGRTRDEENPPITPRLEKGKRRILEITEKMLNVFSDNQVALSSDEEGFLESKRFALVNVVYEWARGMSFKEIMELSSEAEGTIVRVITRLDEVCREVKSAALIIGDSALHAKMTEAQEKIKRDIVFCASLYL
ncbi:hypothetical protein BABINDRAFT_60276 [Babjeviella inositovora NRRL Y-12698]|uniref:Antiviral helicase n=1 Tax=Babjeviella inositovora NRRL Y-12698 TaxID=984486 RepID=A0A1E3QS28_9ASCO|nr:uncharacterized protein BABINDRAFT_60276 [Babjeviella inositovora NRRL Y-12698]ODQ80470.1 hypothetical protein BABINDRAFT_60276 [Babjeviella inositovora NRRL Y-12698]